MNAIQSIRNTVVRRMDAMFPGFFAQAKHNHYADFGYPTDLSFKQLYDMYTRNGIAHAGVEKTILKTWQDMPFLLEKERDGSEGKETKETKLESDIRQRFADLRFWQQLAEADRRSLVGGYSGVILRLADSKKFQEPVDTVPGGPFGLVELIPAWEGQLQVSEWDTDETSENYGHPKMYQFNESQVDQSQKVQRQFQLHPDRVLIWSRDGTVHNRSLLEPGYNDLMTLEKVSGAGGEGFWKNAKSAPVFEIDKEARLEDMARAMGINVEDVADSMDEQVKDWQKGFDQMLMVQGMQAKTLGITLPSPEHFFAIALQSFAASIPIPMKILVGSQSGERASTEDAEEWAQTNMSRRTSMVIPNTMSLINRLERFNILPEKDWFLQWKSLQDPGPNEILERVERMANVNDKMKDSGEFVFTPEELRAETGREPLTDAEKYRDTDTDDDKEGAVTPPAKTPAKEETQ